MTHAVIMDLRMLPLARIKPPMPPPEPGDLVRLPLTRHAFVYQRLSTHEQRKRSLWSLEMQEALFEQAKADGYREDQVVVERRDLGISGTKGKAERPGLAVMIEAIEADAVEAVYVVHISRISRDQTLIGGLEFGELCKQHGVLIVMPTLRLNLRDAMHMRLYRQEIERAADEIDLLKLRLGGPKRHKALSGRFDGRSVAPGYLVDHAPTSETYERYMWYPPHAEVVRLIFQAILATGTPTRAARWLRDRGIILPDFGADIPPEDVQRSSLVRHTHPQRCPGGFLITPSLVQSVATNPVYLGWWLVAGRVVHTENHPPIMDEDTFMRTQHVLTDHGRPPTTRGGVTSAAPQLLSGLLWCTQHEVPVRTPAARVKGGGRYLCDDSYTHAQTDHPCTLLDARLLDDPITDVVLRRCQFIDHADAVLAQLDTEYAAVQEDTRRRQRERRRLQQEIDTLQQNLALTRTPEQVAMLFEQIERRQQCLAAVSDTGTVPGRRALSATQVATVRAFLADLRTGWEGQPAALRHEFVRLILDRVRVHTQHESIEATIVWRSGVEQHLWIERPLPQRGGKERWTEADHAWLRESYASSTRQALEARFPHRSYQAIRRQAETLGLKRPQHGLPKPKGTSWSAKECAVLQAYAASELSVAELSTQLPGRSWDAMVSQGRLLDLRFRRKAVYYRLLDDTREIIDRADSPQTAGTAPPRRRVGTPVVHPESARMVYLRHVPRQWHLAALINPTAAMVWCGARNGHVVTTAVRSPVRSATRGMRVVSRASATRIAGRMVVR
jgi:DNA invertase Pin-like site-specific DNA recombinase